MATKSLIEKIEALSPDKRVQVEHFVDALGAHGTDAEEPPGLAERLRTHRNRLLHKHGLFESVPLIRELRDSGT